MNMQKEGRQGDESVGERMAQSYVYPVSPGGPGWENAEQQEKQPTRTDWHHSAEHATATARETQCPVVSAQQNKLIHTWFTLILWHSCLQRSLQNFPQS